MAKQQFRIHSELFERKVVWSPNQESESHARILVVLEKMLSNVDSMHPTGMLFVTLHGHWMGEPSGILVLMPKP